MTLAVKIVYKNPFKAAYRDVIGKFMSARR
jgi:hypothetical protein